MKKISLLSTAILITLNMNAQDPQFTQFFNNPLYTNPAFTGSAILEDENFATRINLSYRNQWPNLRGNYQTLNLAWDKQVREIGGFGAMITNDVAGSGLLTSTSANFLYAKAMSLTNKISLRAGIQASYVNKSLNFDQLFKNPINPVSGFVLLPNEPLPEQSVSFFNLGFGVITYIKNVHIGFAAHNITEPNQSFYGNVDANLPRRFTIHAGGKFPVFQSIKWKSFVNPNILYAAQQNFGQVLLNTNISIGRVAIGAGFRQATGTFGNADAVIGYLGYNAPRYRFMYSYDQTVSSARTATGGSHELGMHYLIGIKRHVPSERLISPSY